MPIARSRSTAPVFTGSRIATFDLPAASPRSTGRLLLVLRDLAKTVDSLVLRLYLVRPGAAAQPLGEVYTYGEGPRDAGGNPERFAPVTMTLDVTASARLLTGPVEIYLRVFDPRERELAGVPITLESVELTAGESP